MEQTKADALKVWLNTLMSGIEADEFADQWGALIERCGRDCAARCGMAEKAEGIRSKIADIRNLEEVADVLRAELGDMFSTAGNGIIGEFGDGKCVCPIVREGFLVSPMQCNCTKGFNKSFFGAILGKPVRVEIVDSVLRGGSTCKLLITPDDGNER